MKKPMSVILVNDIKNLGKAGDEVNVRPGYGRNYLLPRKMAVMVSAVSIERAKKVRAERRQKEKKLLEELKKELVNLKKIELTFKTKVKEKDKKLYGSVGASEIVKALKAEGLNVKKSWIVLKHPFKELGDFEVQIKPHEELEGSVKIKIVADKKAPESKKK